MNKCIACANFSLKNSPLATTGWGYCSHEKTAGVYYSSLFGRDCDKYTQATEAEMIDRRVEWKKLGI